MKVLECIVFNVDHGFSAFIKSPNNYGLLIDFGGRENFSPIKWIKSNYNLTYKNIEYFKLRRIALAIITHLHIDHFSDVGAFEIFDNDPKRLKRDKETLHFIDKKIKEAKNAEEKNVLKSFNEFQKQYDQDPENEIDWGFEYFKYDQISYKDAQDVSISDDKLINNRSYLIAIKYGGHKILFTGDMEIEGWKKVFNNEYLKNIMNNTDFFMASHHGHKSGFTADILDYSGKPYLYFISTKRGDEHVDSSYSNEDYSRGYRISGKLSRLVSTRQGEDSLMLRIFENGLTQIQKIETADNLNLAQKKRLYRRSKKIIKGWT